MLDLNLNFIHEDGRAAVRGEIEESGTSNSSILNAEGCNSSNVGDGDVDGDDSVAAAGDVDNFHCFNFDILKVGDTGALLSNRTDQDRPSQTQAQTQSEFVTQTFFPISHGDGRFNPGQQVNSFLFPNHNGLQEVNLAQVQQQKAILQVNQVAKKSRRGPRSRSSQYRGVTFYRRTGRWESHIWDCGKQVYLGGFDTAHAAARAYDRAAIKFRGVDADINFNISDYEDDMNQIQNLSKEDFVQLLRRHSNGFSRGNSKYRGVTINKCAKKESITNFEANAYEGKTVVSPYGNGHSLDLNLGISTPSCASRSKNMDPMQFNHGSHDIRRLHMENHATIALKGLPIISELGQSLSGMYPTFFPGYKVGPTNTRMIGGPSNWASQLHGQSHTSTTSFTAASSRFPASAATAAISAAATNCHDFYYRMIPPPSPPPAPPPTP